MVKFLSWLIEKIMIRRKKPWAIITLSGIDQNDEVRFDIAYNKAFIKNLDNHGLTGIDDDQTFQNFLFGTFIAPKGLFEEDKSLAYDGGVPSASHPNLTEEANELVKGSRFINGNNSTQSSLNKSSL